MHSSIVIAASLLASTASALPFGPGFGGFGGHVLVPKLTGCDVSKATFTLPAGIAAPAGKPIYVALGRGTQNYTCTNGTYGNNMAVAALFDASCAVGNKAIWDNIAKLALAGPDPTASPTTQFASIISSCIGKTKLGDHYFQKLTPTSASANPVFDMRSSGKSLSAFAKVNAVTGPTGAKDIAWLQLNGIQGDLATGALRINTAGGVAPATCTKEGEVLKVPYAAAYVFYK